ncbi:MAG: methylenetetrahydrofolate--tRNA-(uracil(54)-C(5))-methyltransferase (FADH(2)-oxidizing) TrmFO [Thermoanaerobaculia bacterium]|nr:MAG: methylenetetrahydrofolate--tRNA-(uracil(54)-C(5))-methyltransferase (FADH(2)-oxidizing) TrmFO [Thermoanaerobaculia bacterium]MBZ0101933.1 methylenetetrahydrofolate--tRNA-(uracil(54)-C(5))-methyltransferase (FADH(2)-oxidizing) TrmFO [Thermoanaerobaculia bacterium]
MQSSPVHVIGAGLAGSECAFQLASRGVPVVLHEMRPLVTTGAHHTDRCAELVCSNSLRSDDPEHAAGLLKREMAAFDSLVIGAARLHAVPAGSALAVDRDLFAGEITHRLAALPGVELRRGEVTSLPEGDVVLATGPLTSPALAARLGELLGTDYLYFYDAIAPIVDGESLDQSSLFWASRYDKGSGDDYLNVPLDRPGYEQFHRQLVEAEVLPLHDFEKGLFFEGCLPIEELARRGVDTLRYGPMKPVGLRGPDGRRPWAVVQLRAETLERRHFNLVGFQSRMKWPDQQRVFATLPGFAAAEFVRLGQIHRNTFVNSPRGLDPRFRVRSQPRVRLAGQITGVEGYLESAATGLAVALDLLRERRDLPLDPPPPTTGLGALVRHLTESDPDHFQPANVHYGLFPPLEPEPPKRERRAAHAARAARDLAAWRERCGI